MLIRQSRALVRTGFTLMEMLVVVAILVVLAGAAVPIYMNYLERAKVDRAWADAKTLAAAAEAYKLSHEGNPPTSLADLTTQDPVTGKSYLEPSALKDPWKNDYRYAAVGTHGSTGRPEVSSGGPNGSMEIGSWMSSPTTP
jgi:general secretion pathway protein G